MESDNNKKLLVRNSLGLPFELENNILYLSFSPFIARMPLENSLEHYNRPVINEIILQQNVSGDTYNNINYIVIVQGNTTTSSSNYYYLNDGTNNACSSVDWPVILKLICDTSINLIDRVIIDGDDIYTVPICILSNNLIEKVIYDNTDNRYDPNNMIQYKNGNLIWPWPNGINPQTGYFDGMPRISNLYLKYTAGDLSGTEIIFDRQLDVLEHEIYTIKNSDIIIDISTQFLIYGKDIDNSNIEYVWGVPDDFNEYKILDYISLQYNNSNNFYFNESILDGISSGKYNSQILFAIRNNGLTTIKFYLTEIIEISLTNNVIFESFYISTDNLNPINNNDIYDLSYNTKNYWYNLLTSDLSTNDISGITLIYLNTNNNKLTDFKLEYDFFNPNNFLNAPNNGSSLQSYFQNSDDIGNKFFNNISISTSSLTQSIDISGTINTNNEKKLMFIVFGINFLGNVNYCNSIDNGVPLNITYKSIIDKTNSAPGYATVNNRKYYTSFSPPYNTLCNTSDVINVYFHNNNIYNNQRIQQISDIDTTGSSSINSLNIINTIMKTTHDPIVTCGNTIVENEEPNIFNMSENIRYELKSFCEPLPPLSAPSSILQYHNNQILKNNKTISDIEQHKLDIIMHNSALTNTIELEIKPLTILSQNDLSINFIRIDINSTTFSVERWKGLQFKVKLYMLNPVRDGTSEIIYDLSDNSNEFTQVSNGIYKYSTDNNLDDLYIVSNALSSTYLYLIGLMFNNDHSLGTVNNDNTPINTDGTALYIPVTQFPDIITLAPITIATNTIPCRSFKLSSKKFT